MTSINTATSKKMSPDRLLGVLCMEAAPLLLQVIMLSSVPELHGYIDKSQLTEDLGGTLDYCHTRWLCHRTVSLSGTLLWMWASGCGSQ